MYFFEDSHETFTLPEFKIFISFKHRIIHVYTVIVQLLVHQINLWQFQRKCTSVPLEHIVGNLKLKSTSKPWAYGKADVVKQLITFGFHNSIYVVNKISQNLYSN